jgi:hypothetical protein
MTWTFGLKGEIPEVRDKVFLCPSGYIATISINENYSAASAVLGSFTEVAAP